jgi:hypothetical protein
MENIIVVTISKKELESLIEHVIQRVLNGIFPSRLEEDKLLSVKETAIFLKISTATLSFKNKREEIVYNELSLTRFNYFSLGDIEKDFKDMEYFLANSIADIQQNLLITHENLIFPEFDLREITCHVLEKIIQAEN